VQEILASGCVPLFLGLDGLPNNTMQIYPRHLFREALALPGLVGGRVEAGFDMNRYLHIASQLLIFTKRRLIAGHFVDFMCHVIGNQSGPILLFHSAKAVLHLAVVPVVAELRRRYGDLLVDYPGIPEAFLYDTPRSSTRSTMGRWPSDDTSPSSSPKMLQEERPHKYYNQRAIRGAKVDRSPERIEQMLRERVFSVVIVPELRWGDFDVRILELAMELYRGRQLVFLDDCDSGAGASLELIKRSAIKGTLFMRELPDTCF